MIHSIITFSVRNKLIVWLAVLSLIVWGVYSLTVIPIGAVPDVTNNQVQILTTTRNLATEEVEKFITYPVELEMSNLPGVQEIRSVSKFGLSVVTVVFDEKMGTYLPRQLIAEKLKSAEALIPSQFGTPEMGPITTGLGEIYQYVLDVDPAFADRYTITDLRTIQDWIVKRQLSGIQGVIEVNTWGGFLKQYEIALNPKRMMELDLSVGEVFAAVEANNDVTGGGYIEKQDDTYFIRGDGQSKSLEEIGQFVVKRTGGVPILVRDVATVQVGHATRFGAITGNGQGEKVMGQIMMLKDANSSEVIRLVKERVAEIQESLPTGIRINPILERTELIQKTTATVEENLLLGALIVIFVIVLLLGNLRSGLIVASVIPLSLLFGISMMNLFGISANLMSLGAIDFGIMVDGAVIIVEFILFRFAGKLATDDPSGKMDQFTRDEITIDSANKVMQPAIFGQIIILIVFIPILVLTGVEGKMFKPMALSFSFTLIGAMILSLTYVPMVSSLFIKGSTRLGVFQRISERIMTFVIRLYEPTLTFALQRFKWVLSIAVVLLAGSAFLFSRMGGEFVPTLDEGDFVVQPVLKTGTSLSKTVEIMTQLEQILLTNFPEVDQIVTRIGAAEVPTDPMSLEEADVIIKLKPRVEWVSAASKEELAEKMKEAMSVLPGIDFEFTQPIEMRFNELITGVRSDVAIKIYGENLDSLQVYADKVSKLIKDVKGASDVVVEKTDNLPQINVTYDRARLAQLGLNTADLNKVLQLAFGGAAVSSVYEGEKRFDMVVRYQAESRQDIDDMRNIFIDLPDGGRVPLREVANIAYQTGPAKISRDNTKRRIVIGINVRDRDVESLVHEIQGILATDLRLPEGYYVTYGGQFENLQHAIDRLKVAVPAALLLILIMLHFAFGSLRQALMVYSAIPLAAIGGIVALYLRGLPFSISAGVGFIALFGIAVLNGIVLIEFFNHLKKDGMTDILERIQVGTKQRLRPVLLTAGAAALGFLPMAISHSAGAEVQRPLATVVIGGLVTSTFLTLVVLPILYRLFGDVEDSSGPKRRKLSPKAIMLSLAALLSIPALSQDNAPLTLEDAVQIAQQNNPTLKAYALDISRSEVLKKAAVDMGKTNIYYGFDENNIAENGYPLRVYGLSQSIPFPSVMGLESRLARRRVEVSQAQYAMEQTRLTREVSRAYFALQYLQAKYIILSELDSVFQESLQATTRRYGLGEEDQLEWLNAKAHAIKLQQQRADIQTAILNGMLDFRALLQTDAPIELARVPLTKLSINQQEMGTAIASNIGHQRQKSLLEMKRAEMSVERSKWLPDINLEYFYGFGMNENAKDYVGYQIGFSVPLFFHAQKGRAQAKTLELDMQAKMEEAYRTRLESTYGQHVAELANAAEKLAYYESEGLEMADQMLVIAHKKYAAGETGFTDFIKSLENAQFLKITYLDALNDYNQLILTINYLTID